VVDDQCCGQRVVNKAGVQSK